RPTGDLLDLRLNGLDDQFQDVLSPRQRRHHPQRTGDRPRETYEDHHDEPRAHHRLPKISLEADHPVSPASSGGVTLRTHHVITRRPNNRPKSMRETPTGSPRV